jgi:type VI secretion system protein ImpK
MTPAFAKAVDPIFLCVLDLLERIEQNKPIVINEERSRIQRHIDNSEMKLGNTPDWELAKYAMVSWIDSMLIGSPWSGSNWWENNPLERTYFFGRNAFTQFFTKAKEASMLTNKDALEVYYLCVVLGFRGFYNEPTAAQYASQMGLPPRLEEWANQTAASIQIGLGRPQIENSPIVGDGAPPLDGKSRLVTMSLVGTALVAAALAYALLLFPTLGK